ncbi:hypothetical protein V8B97DRAFT_1915370 [Scleroderma yunnanense]
MSARSTRKRNPLDAYSHRKRGHVSSESESQDSEHGSYPNVPHKRRKARRVSLIHDSEDDDSDEYTAAVQGTSLAFNPPQGKFPVAQTDLHVSDFSTCVEPVYHIQNEHEFVEDADFQVIGETCPVEDSSEDEDGVPVRVLTDFSIYEVDTQRLVPIAELLAVNHGMSGAYAASGFVKPCIDADWLADDDQDIEEEDNDYTSELNDDLSQRVKLSCIKKFTLHDMQKQGHGLDRHVLYILSQHAWYILDMPSSVYKPFYVGFWLKHRILHLLVTAVMNQPRIKYHEFVTSLQVTPDSPDDVSITLQMLGRSITEDDLQDDDVKSYILATLEELREDERISIRRAPVIRSLLGQEVSYEMQDSTTHEKPTSGNRLRPSQSRTPANVELQVLEHRNKTVVTPTVGRIAEIFFSKNIKVSGNGFSDYLETDNGASGTASIVHHANPNAVKWLKPAAYPGYYLSVLVDGVTYSVGDTVMVEPGVDENKARAKNYLHVTSHSTNSLANTRWFCRIRYLFQDKSGRKRFHAQWLTHSSKTLLQEVGHPQALYLMLNECENIDVDAICQMCHVQELDPDVHEPNEANITEENDFHCRLVFNSTDASILALSAEQIHHALAHCDEHEQCLSCGFQAMQQSISHPRSLPDGGFAQHEFSYHPQDFVYIKNREPHSVYTIGQILKIKAKKVLIEVTVQLFGHYDDVVRQVHDNGEKSIAFDDRQIFITDEVQIVHDCDLEGICYVIHSYDTESIDEWVKQDDHYFVNQAAPLLDVHSLDELHDWPEDQFQYCKQCRQDHDHALKYHSQLLQRHGWLHGMELFSGAGGLGTGLDLSGFVETRWAIEFSPSAAQTYQINHPGTIVYNQCTNLCLQHAIDTVDGKSTRPLFSIGENRQLPPMPKQGEVDFIYGGPPCQSFSLMNHNKKNDDIRSTLVCNMLSYIEFYRPMYLLLENVYGLVVHSLKPSEKDQVRLAVVKFIQRALVAIGYQSRFTVLQAAQFGVPQSRRRVIFWGARQDVVLPEWPLPTHCSPSNIFRVQLPFGSMPPVIRNKNNDDGRDDDRSAPRHFVTISEAIGDLWFIRQPPFDWINPHEAIPISSKDKSMVKQREKDGIPSFHALDSPSAESAWAGYVEPRKHHLEPLSRYQKWMRQNRDGRTNTSISYHYTRRFRENVLERVCTVPMKPGANHFDLPKILHMGLAKGRKAEYKYKNIYRRLDEGGLFATTLTNVLPNNKSGAVLHPSQKRILTVRECARAQGFPDYYEFVSVNESPRKVLEDQLRQIGNAVPVPFAYALGKSLGRALLKMWEEKEREGSPEL